ncbi:hypothetical protein [Paraglaciecola hydrolytica]|uniref:Uncharacterized protein n=1 Tax=Paraglaciecola hydrolytica TaxID=1799789 RepID=A0A136A0B2_9ALTE|nr:hypothetical protein [Paraglaciecola hydrolytica]KXI28665.1 hypothetical protein AX660_16450 [Paraglaciecola hydrolytica]
MDIDPSGLSSLRAIGVPLTRKDKSRPVGPENVKQETKNSTEITIVKSGSEPVFKQAEAFRGSGTSGAVNGLKQQVAIEAYQSIAKEQQRQDIQMLLGVDTFV